jgi:hypothetical protein
VKFVTTKKKYNKFFFTSLFCYCFWIRDSGSGQDPDPPHCMYVSGTSYYHCIVLDPYSLIPDPDPDAIRIQGFDNQKLEKITALKKANI